MALAIDSSDAGTSFNATSGSLSHTCSGSNRVLYARIIGFQDDTVTGVTYAGSAMTRVAYAPDGGAIRGNSQIWRLIAPATGANNITVSMSVARRIYLQGISFTGADQTTPDGTPNQQGPTTSSTAPSIAVSSAAGEIVIDAMGALNNPTATVGAGQTQDFNLANSVSLIGCGSNEAGAASVTMSWTLSAANFWWTCAIPVKPVSVVTSVPSLTLLGVG